ncbi:MAG TPA: hypothetical protein VIJ05_07755, partial [Actinomycetes bacterium]
GTTGAGSGTGGGSGSTAGASGEAGSAWFVAGGRRLAQVPLARLDPGGAATTSTLGAGSTSAPGMAPTSSLAATTPSTAAPAPSATAAPGSGGPSGAALTVGTVVRVWAVPPGAAVPAIDPFLRRAPP